MSGAAAWTKFNLNSAGNDQFVTIPGVGDKMLDEFNEYKPYSSILQFCTEIGKYVDDSEVAAYEAYLFVPVDPNTADSDTLQQLPGVSSDIAGLELAVSLRLGSCAAPCPDCLVRPGGEGLRRTSAISNQLSALS